MKIDISDLKKALDYMEVHSVSYIANVQYLPSSGVVEFEFVDKSSKNCTIMVFEESKKLVPKLIISCNLPKVDKNGN
jgi:hypothetical protein